MHDILVHAKEIVGGVLALNLGDEIVVQFVCGAHAIAFVGTEEIDVYAAVGKGREALKKLGPSRCTAVRRPARGSRRSFRTRRCSGRTP